MPALPPELDALVERHWDAACAEARLFNGRIFSADTVGPEEITGHWSEYRRTVAQMRDPALTPVVGVRNLAVCGVLSGPDGVAIGRRDPAAAYQPGLWQMPPAGSVDAGAAEPGGASWRRALMTELREELGIGEDQVGPLRPLCVVHHPSGVLDMGVLMPTALTGAEVLAAHRACGDKEYDRMRVLMPQQVLGTLAAEGEPVVPAVVAFLAAAFSR